MFDKFSFSSEKSPSNICSSKGRDSEDFLVPGPSESASMTFSWMRPGWGFFGRDSRVFYVEKIDASRSSRVISKGMMIVGHIKSTGLPFLSSSTSDLAIRAKNELNALSSSSTAIIDASSGCSDSSDYWKSPPSSKSLLEALENIVCNSLSWGFFGIWALLLSLSPYIRQSLMKWIDEDCYWYNKRNFFLYTKENIIHGNLTSSNILLEEKNNPKMVDVRLSRLMTTNGNTNIIATTGILAYHTLEFSKINNASTNMDAYSLGVIILELLIGNSPSEAIDGLNFT
ncbi:putative leucine-rich repeat receptor-like protein kinase IMK3 [Capsicum chinense]|nr:putative leucine-rich repeat receptor-like protein kinase IMK3 [Capsicum chinense]